MLYKELRVALILSCLFALRYSQCIEVPSLTDLVTPNLCNNISYAICHFCLGDGQTYMLGFQSRKTCKSTFRELNNLPQENASVDFNECPARNELQATLNLETLKQVCEMKGIKEIIYQQESDLCRAQIVTGQDCYRLECIKNYDLCDNYTKVIEDLKKAKVDGDQIYDVIFSQTKKGKRSCIKTSKKLSKLPKKLKKKNVKSTLYTESCRKKIKILSATLNSEGLEWVCKQKQITRVTFEETRYNESICLNVTRAKSFFFADPEPKQFRISFLNSTDAEDTCKKVAGELKNLTTMGIIATINIDDCDKANKQIQGDLNYEAIEFVCHCTDPDKVNVVYERKPPVENDITPGPVIGG